MEQLFDVYRRGYQDGFGDGRALVGAGTYAAQ
jgi:hypothetical protein